MKEKKVSEKKDVSKNNIENKAEVKEKKEKKSNKRMIFVILFLIVVLCSGCIILRGSYLEKMEIGQQYVSVFWTNFEYNSISFLITFLIMFLAVYFSNRRIYSGLKDFYEDEKKTMKKLPNKSISLFIAVLVSIFTLKTTAKKLILFLNSTSFESSDKVFNFDIGYYLFQKPFIEYILWFGIIAVVALTIYMGVYYVLALNTQFDGVRSETLKKSKIVGQLLSNAKVLAFLIAILTFFKTQDLSASKFLNVGDKSSYALYGAGVADISIKLWGYRILSILIVISVFMAVGNYKKGKTKKVIGSILTVPVYLCLLGITLIGYNSIFIKSNEFDKQKKYINYNIENTRQAYGIQIDEIDVGNDGALIDEDIAANENLLNKVSIVNKNLVLQNLNGTLTNKGYYIFNSSQIGEYLVNGEDSVVYISPREIVNQDNSYVNSTYEYTHGYGVIATSANKISSTGTLENYQKGFTDNDIKITEPRIYFGLQTNETIVTNTETQNEFDYPQADGKNATNEYNGKAGLQLGFMDRIILSITHGDVKLAFSSDINSNSKILTNRNIIKRAKEIMPYLTYDENPYLVITDSGKLVWVLDAYTTSNYFPYSQKSSVNGQDINYIRNSVKVIVDAYEGTTKFYITDRTDPIVMAYRKAYSNLFVDLDEAIPTEISNHFVYPQYLYKVQAEALKRYHSVQADVLYRADDVWDIATYSTGNLATASSIAQVEPYYTALKVPNSNKNVIGLVLPYTISGKQNLTSYLVGTYENGQPKLQLYNFPDDSNVVGLLQLDTQIEQNEAINKQIRQLNVTGTKLTKQITVVPIDNKLLYIEAIYQQYINEENSLPTLKKIVVASGNKVAIGNDLHEALANLVSNAIDIEIEDTDEIEDLIELIIKANENLKQSTANGDWEMVGKDMEKLQSLVDKLDVVYNKEKEKKNKANTITPQETTENNENKKTDRENSI
jgi:hypothetical protein